MIFLLISNNMVRGVIPTQLENFALHFVEFQEVSLDPALQPIQFPLNGSATPGLSSASPSVPWKTSLLFIKKCSIRSRGKKQPCALPRVVDDLRLICVSKILLPLTSPLTGYFICTCYETQIFFEVLRLIDIKCFNVVFCIARLVLLLEKIPFTR